MKIGILTFHHTTNYGATLQAYALFQTIKKQGHNVEIIDYQPYKAVKTYIKTLYFNHHFLSNAVKSWKMRKFLHSQIQLSTNRCYTRKGLKNWEQAYDIVICGSDEIWNINSFRGFDTSYFLDFVNSQKTRKISYAASFGFTTTLGKNREKVAELLKEFKAISVRDSNSLRIVEEECQQSATKVLDPTFLVDYTKIISQPKINDDYLLIYGGLSKEDETYVKKAAKAEGLKIVSVGYPSRIAQINLVGIGPEEWLGYFAKASYVFTSFYHGAIFSIIFRKPFTVFGRQDKMSKVQDLLKDFKLENRIVKNSLPAWEEQKINIDYDVISSSVEKAIEKSKTYLFEALN